MFMVLPCAPIHLARYVLSKLSKHNCYISFVKIRFATANLISSPSNLLRIFATATGSIVAKTD